MTRNYIIASLIISQLILIGFLIRSRTVINNENVLLLKAKSQAEFYRLKSTADSLLNYNEYDKALSIYYQLDSIGNNRMYSSSAMLILKERTNTNMHTTLLAEQIKERSSVIRNLYQNKNQLNDSLETVKQTLETLQNELDSVLVCNSNITHQVNMLNDSINTIKLNDTLTIYGGDNISIKYLGHVKNGKAHGYGYAVFDNKGFYEGNWKNSLRNGKGKYSWQNGDLYEGEYRNDLRNGYGIYHFKSGEQYIGSWRNDLRHGEGVLIDKNNKELFKGIWENDKPKY